MFVFNALFPIPYALNKNAAEQAFSLRPSRPPTHGDTSIIFNFTCYNLLQTVNKSSIIEEIWFNQLPQSAKEEEGGGGCEPFQTFCKV